MEKAGIPFFKKADLDASIGVFFDGFSKVIVAIAILAGTFGLDGGTIFGTMMPGVFLTVVILNGGLWLYYRKIAAYRGDPDLTAIPAGLQAGRMFIWLYSIMLPVFLSTGNADLAFKTGVLAHLVGGIIFIIGAFVVPVILRIVPAGALFGSLAGGAMAFLIMQSMNGVLKMPFVGWLSLMVLFVIYLGKVEVKLPAALIAIVIGSAVAWISGVMGFGAVTESLSNLDFYIPHPVLDIFNPQVVGSMVPFLPIINAFIPEAVVLPILVFVGISSYSQAFEVVDKKYFPAVIMASLPVVMDFIVDNMREGALPGFTAFDSGSAFVGLLVGCVFVFIIDNNWKNASITNAAALALTGIGMIHSPGILGTAAYAPDMGFVQVYIVLMIVFAVMHFVGFNQKKTA